MKTKTFKWFSLIAVLALAMGGLLLTNNQVPTVQAANPSATLDQCANGTNLDQNGCDGIDGQWVNGNLNASKALYYEGDSVPYRMRFANLPANTQHTVTIEWDTTKSSKHALDYITVFNRTVADANPCLGVSGCDINIYYEYPIPADPQITGFEPIDGNFILYGGTIDSLSAYTYPNGDGFVGDMSARISITFTADVKNPVLAWGGHISTRLDWGLDESAVSISGSPYHTRLIDLDGAGGNQDRSLSAEAVIFPGSITIVKDATPNSDTTEFGFTASPSPLYDFSLIDDGTVANNTKVFSEIKTFTTYTITEADIPIGWGFDSVSCDVTSPFGGSYTTSSETVNIVMKEGENWTCTYLDSSRTATLTVKKHVINNNGGLYSASSWSIHVKSGSSEAADISGSPASPQSGSESGTTYTLLAGTYTVSETDGPSGYTFDGFSGDCNSITGSITLNVGDSKTCTLTNNDQPGTLIVKKIVINNSGGDKVATDFSFQVNSGTAIPFVEDTDYTDHLYGKNTLTVDAGHYTVTEPAVSGYYTTYDNCTNVEVTNGGSATCTITNDDQQGSLTLVKRVVNDNGGEKTVADFNLSTDAGSLTFGDGVADGTDTLKYTSNKLMVNAGTYTLREDDVAGYTEGTWSCDAGTLMDSSIDKGSITVPNGVDVVCEITNNDDQGSLTLVKKVINDNGGTLGVSDFSITTTAGTLTPWTSEADGTTTTYTSAKIAVNATSYTFSESEVAGYTEGTWSCTGATATDTAYNAGSVTVPNGVDVTCTITNNDDKAQPSGETTMSWVIYDSLTITGLRADAPDASSARVTFQLYSDATFTTQVGSDDVVGISGGVANSHGFTVTAGTYYWVAVYSGDQFNNGFTVDGEVTTIGESYDSGVTWKGAMPYTPI
jgi:hypothetical protein